MHHSLELMMRQFSSTVATGKIDWDFLTRKRTFYGFPQHSEGRTRPYIL